jgi:hypothetical protein
MADNELPVDKLVSQPEPVQPQLSVRKTVEKLQEELARAKDTVRAAEKR